MRRVHGHHKRPRLAGKRNRGVVTVCLILAVVVFGIIRYGKHLFPAYYEGLLIAGDPVTLAVRVRGTNSLVIVSVPADVWIEATRGYGRYSLAALWKLGRIDQKSGSLLSESLSETLKIPVSMYIGRNTDDLLSFDNGLSELRSVFTFSHIGDFLMNKYTTNMDFIDFARFAVFSTWVSDSDVTEIALTRPPAISRDQLADGTRISYINPDALDTVIDGAFELEAVRKERIAVAILNATTVPGLGEGLAKMLSRMGILVVSVGNTGTRTRACVISANADKENSITVEFLKDILPCREEPADSDSRADITVTIGDDYAAKFLKR